MRLRNAKWPLVRRAVMDRQIRDIRISLQNHYDSKEAELVRRLDGIVEKYARIRFERPFNDRVYQVRIDLDPRLMNELFQPYADRKIMAGYIGQMVAAEVASTNFLREADEGLEARKRGRGLDFTEWDPSKTGH